MSGSKGGNTTQTTTSEIPGQVKPYVKPYLERANTLSQAPYQAYTGERVAEINPYQWFGMGMQGNQATNGVQGQSDAGNVFQNTLRGDYMSPDSNPWLKSNVDQALESISNSYRNATLPQTNSAFGRTGAFGGSAWNQAVSNNENQLAKNLGNTASQMYGSNYANERNNQMSAMGMLPMFQNVGYTDAAKMTNIGDNLRQYQTDVNNVKYSDWLAAQQDPYNKLDFLGNALRTGAGLGGQTQTTTMSGGYKPSPFASALGGGLSGFGLTGSPWGALAGGVMGIL